MATWYKARRLHLIDAGVLFTTGDATGPESALLEGTAGATMYTAQIDVCSNADGTLSIITQREGMKHEFAYSGRYFALWLPGAHPAGNR